MKKLLTLVLVSLGLTISVFAQKSKTPVPTTPRPAPKGPSPYVLKKEYEPKMTELTNKVNAAANTAGSLRRGMEDKFAKINQLDSEMTSVQSILNSTNFLLNMNSDSLAKTKSTMDELANRTESNFNRIEESNAELSKMLWMVLGASVTLTIIVLIVLLSMMNKRLQKLEVALHMSEEVLKKSLTTGLEKQQVETKEGLNQIQSKITIETSTVKREISHQLTKDLQATHQSVEILLARIEKLEQANTPADPDPEVFI